MPAIVAKNLTKRFGDLTAVDDLSFQVAEGGDIRLGGAGRGGGKTTTMGPPTSIMDPTAGEAWIAGYHIKKQAVYFQGKIS